MSQQNQSSEVIVDAHIHLLPGKLAKKVRAFFDEYMLEGQPLAYPLEHLTVLDSLYAAGVGAAWSLPYAHKAGVAAGLNAASAAMVAEYAQHPLRLVGGATVHPADDDPGAIVREAYHTYKLPVLKLHCSVGNYSPDDAALNPVWQAVEELQMPVVAHVGMAVSGHTQPADLLPLHAVARRFPNAPIIIAHCGYPAATTALDLLEQYPALYADLTPMVFELLDLPAAQVAKLANRLLFGSDAPNSGFYISRTLAHIRSWQLSPEAEAAILGGNAARLCPLPPQV